MAPTFATSDLEWLWAQLSNTSDRGNPVEHFAAWEELINRGVRHAALQRHKEDVVVQFYSILRLLEQSRRNRGNMQLPLLISVRLHEVRCLRG